MQEKNNQTTVKILIGVIIGLSVFILLGGIFYIFNMQNKIAKLEIEQEKQLKRQVETQKMASIHQLNTKKEAEVKTEPKVVKAKTNAPKSSYEKAMINRMRPVENELDGYTLDNTSSCTEYVGYREILHKKWDNELNQIYKLLMSKYPESQKTALRNEERAWIKKREKSMDSIASEMNGCMGAAVTIVNSEIDTIKSRAIELARRYDEL
ncbi:lysozyme inhibitor LprI family protein [Leptotrichia trevisanii]|uniref:lysozyme inhibitor LprI family protein n=1 Tax=Leptotrichia trevisanii TaxID=109328 RepID=UPI0003F85B2B|nr:lysozyme inhibitor LprI family protein [Leptotrichia trevisanii]